MIRSLFYLPLIFALSIIACNHTNTPVTINANEPGRTDTMLSTPDAADLLQTLQGRWQSEQDSTYMIEISDDKINHYNNGQAGVASEIEVDGNCQSNACQVDSTNLLNGWCFIEKGQYDAQCNLVVKCDKRALWYQVIGAAKDTLRFRKK